MSLNTYRAQVAVSLSTVDGVTGYARRPKATPVGAAWPLLASLDRGPGFTFAASWRVRVMLPQDEGAASDWIDGHATALAEALEPVGFVDRIEPVIIATSGGDQLALEITLRSE